LKRIGLNKIRLESGIGVILFNLSESYDQLKGSGYLTVSNTYNSSATVTCKVVTKLSTVDLNHTTGKPRIHYTISDNITFYPVPTGSWITLEDDEAVVNPYSFYTFKYAVNIDIECLREQAKKNNNIFNTSEGYLVYINIRKDYEEVTGLNIGIDYNYKLFFVFTGELQEEKQGSSVSILSLVFMIPVAIFISAVALLYKHRNPKKASVTPDTKPGRNNPRKSLKETLDDDVMRQKIDGLLEEDG